MSLEQQIALARKEIISDGYEMSIGEILNLYRDGDLIINPAFQRLFRWEISQKSRFIESLLLGIPIPPIFVVQNDDGTWELIDGLQRLSTVLEFVGVLRNKDDPSKLEPCSVLEGTKFLPDLSGKVWEPVNGQANGIGKAQQLQIKRARMRVEILKKESDQNAKYELFERLNTGGSKLSSQEVRNSVGIMVNAEFQNWLAERAQDQNFVTCTTQTENALEQQQGVELALRFISFRNIPYDRSLDIHDYLDNALLSMARDQNFDRTGETSVFTRTFEILNAALGQNSFKRWNGKTFSGKFTNAAFEVIAVGVAANLLELEKLDSESRNQFIAQRVRGLWNIELFQKNSGAGVRGTTRLSNLLNFGPSYFALNG
jgi:hypothetical protein